MDRLLGLVLAAALVTAPCPCGKEYQAFDWPPLTARDIWAHIVAGEAGGLPDGAELVAWTLRAWEVEKGMPAEWAGPRWGWYGWKEPYAVDYAAVDAVWGQPLSAAPYAWMQAGHYCRLLGNDRDVRYWRGLGWQIDVRYRLEWPEWNMAMNCIW